MKNIRQAIGTKLGLFAGTKVIKNNIVKGNNQQIIKAIEKEREKNKKHNKKHNMKQ